MYVKRKYIVFFLLLVFLSSCARIVVPNGGPRDITAPKVKRSFPAENSVNFSAKEIRIDFDEYITLENISQNLIVSPPTGKKPTVTSYLKSLYIKDLDSLKDNATYIFDFGNAIRDFNEGNPAEHFVFSFSTGSVIDTMFYYGSVLNAYTLKPERDKYVALYSSHDKAEQTTHLPDYITRTDSLGKFNFYNIKEGEYSLLAYDDNNNSMIYDMVTEGIAFSTLPVIAKSKEDSLFAGDTLFFSNSRDTLMKLSSAGFVADREAAVYLSMPVTDSFRVDFLYPVLSEEDYIIEKRLSDTSSEILIYFISSQPYDTVGFSLSDAEGFSEKSEIIFSRPKKKKNEQQNFSFSLPASKIPYYDTLTLNLPFALNNEKSLPLKACIISEGDTSSAMFFADRLNSKRLVSDYSLKENTEYLITIDSSAAENYKGEKNSAFSGKFTTDSKDDYSTFTIRLTDSLNRDKQVIVSLFDEKNNRVGDNVEVKANGEKILFVHLKEGSYKLRCITDDNNNGIWDRNDFILHRQAEKIQYFPKPISIRKAWDLEEEWQISL
ncbi:MAG: Ig-like domain-containing protein [Bacteroidales bacterium]|nr:Ig-like domain-containing protein [Bacteroidales bacterium]